MSVDRVLLFTDIVDSTQLTLQLGDAAASALWAEHDRVTRRLLRDFNGREIDKSDGFLLLFETVGDAVRYAQALHVASSALAIPIRSRAGVHCGAMITRENTADEVALGAKLLELDGVGKAVASRIMGLARGGQTLLSAPARDGLGPGHWHVRSHGHWRIKGIEEPLELFEVSDERESSLPPSDSSKSYRVALVDGIWTPVAEVPHNLPAERDAFVGRLDVLATLAAQFDAGARLVSILGIGGIGKTRVALKYARHWLGDYPGGAWFCDLSAARSQDGILHAMAQGLGLALSGTDPARQIGDAVLGRRECLLVVDNFEQVSQHANVTVGRWLESAPQAKFLVTTRERLGIAGEETLELPTLPVAEGVALLRERAATNGAIAFTPQDEAAVPKLIEMLDALPLAIELAASRMRVLSPTQILPRMGERFRLLTNAVRRQDRQATLRATLDWSWDLLTEPEREVMAQLSLFEGGFKLQAAEAVVALPPDPGPWVVDLLQSLVDKSLVRRAAGNRFNLLRSVQEYAAETMPHGNGSTPSGALMRTNAMQRHWTYFASLSELEATEDRCAEVDNLVVACQRALAEGDIRSAGRAVATTWCAMRITGPLAAAIELADRLHAEARGYPVAAASALWVGGNARQLLGRVDEARRMLEAALAIAQPDRLLTGRIASALGTLLANAGDAERAEGLLETALAAATVMGDTSLRCRVLNSQGVLSNLRARPDEARRCYEAALAVARDSHDARWEGAVLGNLGQLHHDAGAHEEARACYERALDMVRASGDLRFEGNMRCNLGLLHHEEGRPAQAMEEFEASMEIAMRIGHVQLQAIVSCNLGLAHDAAGRGVEALRHFRAAMQAARTVGQRRTEALAQVYLGRTLLRAGEDAQGIEHLEGAQTLLEQASDERTRALLLCAQAEANVRAGNPLIAARLLEEARSPLLVHQSLVDAEVGAELVRVERLVNLCS